LASAVANSGGSFYWLSSASRWIIAMACSTSSSLKITDTPQRKIILVGHLSERLIIHSAVFAECLNAHVFGERGPAFRWRQQNGFHLTFVNFGQASHLA
jgi:hypothetical protein